MEALASLLLTIIRVETHQRKIDELNMKRSSILPPFPRASVKAKFVELSVRSRYRMDALDSAVAKLKAAGEDQGRIEFVLSLGCPSDFLPLSL